MVQVDKAPPGVDPTTPSPARLYDYYLGGEINFQVDCDAAETERIHLRGRVGVERFFEPLELAPPHAGADPTVTYVGEWGAEDPLLADSGRSRVLYCEVARRS